MEKRIVELPINITDIECVTECWTLYKMIILKTSPYYEDWIASRYDLFATDNYKFYFGDMHIYYPEDYDDILSRRKINLFEIEESTIVERLKRELASGFYLNIMIKPFSDKNWFHEVVFYGYDDDRKVFQSIGRMHRSFESVDYSYEYIQETLQEVKNHIQGNRGMQLSAWMQYPINAFRVKEDYNTDNCVFGAYRKIVNELVGECLEVSSMKAPWVFEPYSKKYIGLSCLDALSDLLHKVLNGEIDDEKDHLVVPALKKLHEHRHMMVITMNYIQKKWQKALFPQTADHISSYEKCCETVGKWLNMALKYELTGKTEMLQSILAEIPQVAEREFYCLNELVHNCIDWDKFNENYI